MNMNQFRKTVILADSIIGTINETEYNEALAATAGCAYDKKYCTLKQAAILYNYQTLTFAGTRLSESVNEFIEYKNNIILIDQL